MKKSGLLKRMDCLRHKSGVVDKNINRASRISRVSMVLIFAVLLSIFMLGGWSGPEEAQAAARTASVAGFWSNTLTWGGLSVPVAGDTVTINAGITVQVDTVAACTSIAINAANTINGINITGTNSLAVSGAITTTVPTNNNRHTTIAVGAGSLSAGSIALAGAGTATRYTELTISTGTVTVSGIITSAGAQSMITFSGTGTLYAGGTFMSGTAGTFTAGTGTVNYNAGGAQIIGNYTYNNLTLSGGGVKTENTATVNGILSMEGTATISAVPNYGGAATLQYKGIAAQTTGAEFRTPWAGTGGVKINNANGVTLTAIKTINAASSLTIGDAVANSVFNDGGFQLTSTGTLNLTSGTFRLGSAGVATTFPAFATRNISAGTTVEYAATPNQPVSITPAYQNLIFSGGGTKTTDAGTLSVAGNWAAGVTTALDTNNTVVDLAGNLTGAGNITQGTGAISIAGNWTQSGTFTAGSGGVNYDGSGTQTVKGATYNNITFSNGGANAKTLGAAATVSGNLTINAGATLDVSTNNYSLNVAGNWTNGGTFVSRAGTVTFNGAGSQTINNANTWYGLTITASSARTVSFQSAVAQTIASNGSLTLTGVSGGLLTLAPVAPPSAWLLNVNAVGVTQNISYVSASYSNAGSGAAVVANNGTNRDGGNNTNWIFAPSVTSAIPNNAVQGTTNLDVLINGANFVSGATVSFSGLGITVNSVTFASATHLTANITITAVAALGLRDITVTNPDGSTGTGDGVFSVTSAAASNQQIVQTFYVPIPEDQYRLYASAQTASTEEDTVRSVISITGTFDGTIIYYDQWEDGYEDDITKPVQSTTEIWGDGDPSNGAPPICNTATGVCVPCTVASCDVIKAGSVITLLSDVPVPGGVRDQGSLYYDGRDKFSSTQQLVVTRAMWPIGSPQSIVAQLAGAVEVIDTSKWGTDFIVPVGVNTASTTSFNFTALSIMAQKDGTVVTVLNPGGSINWTATLNQGQTLYVGGPNNPVMPAPADTGIMQGATVSSKGGPVQVDILTARLGSNYDGRLYNLFNTTSWGHDYYSPVSSTREGNGGGTLVPNIVNLYNPDPVNPITVRRTDLSGTANIVIPANTNAQYMLPDPSTIGGALSGARFDTTTTGNQNFYAFAGIDQNGNPGGGGNNGQVHNWGFTMLPVPYLTPTVIIGWAPGTTDKQRDASPVWVTPVSASATTIYVNYSGDPSQGPSTVTVGGVTIHYDVSYSLQPYQAQRLISPGPAGAYDHTGWRVFTIDGTRLAAAWGQDGNVSSGSQPTELDLGTTVLPAPSLTVYKTSALIGDFNSNGGIDPGELIQYTIRIHNAGMIPITNIDITDTLDANVTYVANTTGRASTQAGPFTPIPDSTPGVFPLATAYRIVTSPAQLNPNQDIYVNFQVSVKNPLTVAGATTLINTLTATTASIAQINVTSENWTNLLNSGLNQGGLSTVKVSSKGDSAVMPGDTINYTVYVTNTSNIPQTGVTLNDPLPPGATYVALSTVATGPQNKYVRDEFNKQLFSNNDGPQDWAGDWTESDATQNPLAGNVTVTNGELSLTAVNSYASRIVDMSGFSISILRFNYRLNSPVVGTDSVQVQMSSNGGGSWTTIDTITGLTGPNAGSKTYDVSAYISSSTAVRFFINNGYTAGDYFYVDNVQIKGLGYKDVIDNFGSMSYGNNDGPTLWSGPWVENDAADGTQSPAAGSVQVINTLTPQGLRLNSVVASNAARAVDLTGATYAVLLFNVSTSSFAAGDTVVVEMGTAGTGGTFPTLIDTFTNANTSSTPTLKVYDISSSISATAAVRLRVTGSGGANHYFYADNVELRAGGLKDVLDSFKTASYNNNDGPNNWVAGGWAETDPGGGGAASGNVQAIAGSGLRLNNATAGSTSVLRKVDLSSAALSAAAAKALLKFTFSTNSGVLPTDSIVLEASTTGLAGSFTILDTYTNISGAVTETRAYDITSYRSATTTIQFRILNGYTGATTPYFYANNVEIRAWNQLNTTKDNIPAGVNSDLGSGVPAALVTASDGFVLSPGETLKVTYGVTVSTPPNATRIANTVSVTSNEQTQPASSTVMNPIGQGGSIGGLVWLEWTVDGIPDVSEPGLSNIRIWLDTAGNGHGSYIPGVDMQTLTGTDGKYLFSGLYPSSYPHNYIVHVDETTLPAGLGRTTGNIGPITKAITNSANPEHFSDVNFGYKNSGAGTAVIGNFVWADANNNGVQDPGEVGIGSNLDMIDNFGTVSYSNNDGPNLWKAAWSETDAGGGGAGGGNVQVDVVKGVRLNTAGSMVSRAVDLSTATFATAVLKFNFSTTLFGVGDSVDVQASSDGVTFTTLTGGTINSASTGTSRQYDISSYLSANTTIRFNVTGSVGANHYFYADNVEIQAGGVIMQLKKTSDGSLIASTITNAFGTYLFTGVQSGSYNLLADATSLTSATNGVLIGYSPSPSYKTQPLSQSVSTICVAGSCPPGPWKTDSADSQNPLTVVTGGGTYLAEDFGFYNASVFHSIRDRVWFDLNGNGTCDSGESGISGVTVILLAPNGTVIGSAVTDGQGSFTFSGVRNGSYTIKIEDASGNLSGFAGTSTPAKNKQLAVTVSGTDVSGTNFGYNAPGRIGNTVWKDTNGNGLLDSGEQGIAGVVAKLYIDTNGNGIYDAVTDQLISTTTTNANGQYLFQVAQPGRYFVSIDSSQAPLSGFVLTTTDDQAAAGYQRTVLLPSYTSSDLTANFGFSSGGVIGHAVWNDLNANGVFEPNETGIPGVTVLLYKDFNGNATFEPGTDTYVATTTTDSSGSYYFNLNTLGTGTGTYFVSIDNTQPALALLILTTTDDQTASGVQRTVSVANLTTNYLNANSGFYMPASDLSVTKTATNITRGGTDVYPADTVQYTITITNNSPQFVTQTGITINDPLPTNTSYVAASSSVTSGFKYATTNSAAINPDRDTFIDQAAPNNNNGGPTATAISLEYSTIGNTKRGLLHFNLPSLSLPAWSVINSATMGFTVSTIQAGVSANLYRLVNGSWLEGNGNNTPCVPNTGASWNRYDCANSWASAGGDYDFNTSLGSFSLAAAVLQTVSTGPLTDLIKNCYSGAYPNSGILLDAGGTADVVAAVWSRTGTTPPTLTVNYSYPSGPAVSTPTTAMPTLVPSSDGYILAPGASMTVIYRVLVGATPNIASITNVATVSSNQSNPALATVSNTMKYPSDLKVEKTIANYDSASAFVTYLIKVTNVGTVDQTNVHITDNFDEVTSGMLNCSGTNTNCSQSTVPVGNISYTFNTVTWNVGALAHSTSATLTLKANVVGPGGSTVTNRARLDTTTNPPSSGDSNSANNTSDISFAIQSPTLVFLSDFTAYEENGQVSVRWETVAEHNTLGFNLLRLDPATGDYKAVNSGLLPGILKPHRTGIYTLIDRGASPGKSYTYKLIEVEMSGAKLSYGPTVYVVKNKVKVPTGGPSVSSSADYNSIEIGNPMAGRTAPKSELSSAAVATGATAVDRIKISVSESGIYYVDAGDISSLLGLSPANVSNMISRGQLALSSQGKQAAYMPVANNAGIYFYGTGIDSIYAKENIYWLEKGQGTIMKVLRGAGPGPSSEEESFTETLHFEQNLNPWETLFNDPNADYWFWRGIFTSNFYSDPPATFIFQPIGLAPETTTATVQVNLFGGSDAGIANDHHVVVSLNGQSAEDWWSGQTPHTISFTAPILAGANTLTVEGKADPGALSSYVLINSFDVIYHRLYEASGNRLSFRGDGHMPVTVGGFTSPDIMVFDVTDPLMPKLNAATTIEPITPGYTVSLNPATDATPYFSVTGSTIQRVSGKAVSAFSLSSRSNAADYIVIAPAGLISTAQVLADYRKAQGYKSMVVDIENIMNEFNYGIPSPEAIKKFLSYAYSNWMAGPRYVVLAGDGSMDYKDNLGYGGNLIPSRMVPTPYGLFVSDNYLADVNGDHVPEIAIGRLPVISPDELQTVINKIKTYEFEHVNKTAKTAVLVSDTPDDGGDFIADSEALVGLFPADYTVNRIYLNDPAMINTTRAALITAINQGAAFLNYVGHAGPDQLSDSGILSENDLPLLTNTRILPVMTAMTCIVGNFADPYEDTMSEALVIMNSGVGVAAVWSPSGLSDDAQASILNREFYKAAFSGTKAVLGDVVLKALSAYKQQGSMPFMIDIYNILGDPALRIR